MTSIRTLARRLPAFAVLVVLTLSLSGCASIVVGAATTAVGVVVDVGVGAVKLTGKAVGAVIGSSDEAEKK
jgi:hypothetical protein